MADRINKLSARGVIALSAPGRHSDGGGLYLLVKASGAKSWVFMYKRGTRQREMGLGSLLGVPLSRAREKAAEARRELAEGRDPLAGRAKPITKTFGQCVTAYYQAMRPQWESEKHADNWLHSMTEYTAPISGRPVAEIETADVLSVLQPIWQTKADTATRVRGRIEAVLDAAKAQAMRAGDNPARWRGHLEQLLPRRQKLSRGHHDALHFNEVPGFMRMLEARRGLVPMAFRFTILTAVRSGESLGARWSEIDLDHNVWTIPAERMKARREHRVPLAGAVRAILDESALVRIDDFVFPGKIRGASLAAGALHKIVKDKAHKTTVHGFRSSFRDWAAEKTDYPREIAEAALAHAVGDAVERAYRRMDALEKRRALMEEWAAFCANEAVAVK